MWALSLQHPTLCLFIILQGGYFFSILPFHNVGGWFFSIILDGMAHVIFKLSWLLFLFFNQIIKSGQFFPVSQLTSEKASSFLEFIRGHFFSILSDSIISPIPIFFVGFTTVALVATLNSSSPSRSSYVAGFSLKYILMVDNFSLFCSQYNHL